MKKYSVYVRFTNGQEMKFETDTNVKLASPIIINEQPMIVTENKHAINLRHVEKIEQTELK